MLRLKKLNQSSDFPECRSAPCSGAKKALNVHINYTYIINYNQNSNSTQMNNKIQPEKQFKTEISTHGKYKQSPTIIMQQICVTISTHKLDCFRLY